MDCRHEAQLSDLIIHLIAPSCALLLFACWAPRTMAYALGVKSPQCNRRPFNPTPAYKHGCLDATLANIDVANTEVVKITDATIEDDWKCRLRN